MRTGLRSDKYLTHGSRRRNSRKGEEERGRERKRGSKRRRERISDRGRKV